MTVATFFERYADAYMAADAATIGAMCDVPFLAVREGRAIHLGDRESVREHFAALMTAYLRAGAARAEVSALDVRDLGAASVFATVSWRAVDEGGSVLRAFDTSYHLLRAHGGDGWTILSYTNHNG